MDYIDRYKGVYDAGWDVLRYTRLANMKSAGLVPQTAQTFPRMERVKPWESLTVYERKHFARRMEIYAAMVEHMDAQIGRVLESLKSSGQLDNTWVVFLSDNGPEGNDAVDLFDNYLWVPGTFNNSLENMGHQGSYVSQGTGWAQVSAVPFRLFKSFPSEGGIRVPDIVTAPGRLAGGVRKDALLSVMDVAPTLLELAGIPIGAETRKLPMTGKSFASYLQGRSGPARGEHDALGWELFGRNGLRSGDWKALRIWPPFGPGCWQLFNLREDPTEMNDLAEEEGPRLRQLVAKWHAYAERNGVVVLDQDFGYEK